MKVLATDQPEHSGEGQREQCSNRKLLNRIKARDSKRGDDEGDGVTATFNGKTSEEYDGRTSSL